MFGLAEKLIPPNPLSPIMPLTDAAKEALKRLIAKFMIESKHAREVKTESGKFVADTPDEELDPELKILKSLIASNKARVECLLRVLDNDFLKARACYHTFCSKRAEYTKFWSETGGEEIGQQLRDQDFKDSNNLMMAVYTIEPDVIIQPDGTIIEAG